MPIEIRALTPALLPDWLQFFDAAAFSDNGEWCGCYCMCYHWNAALAAEKPWNCGEADAPINRRHAIDFIESGRMRGYLAYRDGRVVGWCNANDKAAYDSVHFCFSRDVPDDGGRIKSVACFVIDPNHRRCGVATALLEAVLADAARDGYDVVEAYPFAQNEFHAYHGPVALYEKLGFVRCGTVECCAVYRKLLK